MAELGKTKGTVPAMSRSLLTSVISSVKNVPLFDCQCDSRVHSLLLSRGFS